MHIVSNWRLKPSSDFSRIVDAFHSPAQELAGIIPPDLHTFPDAFKLRKSHATSLPREEMSNTLLESHKQRHAPARALENIERLRNPDTFLIVTGQQPGLLGGPLYTFYKILHAIILAENLSAKHNDCFLPAFWNASEDHDFEEVATVHWLSKENHPVSFQWHREHESHPYFAIPAKDCPVDDLLTFVREHSHPTEFSEQLFEEIKLCADQSGSYPDFIDRLIWRIFQDEGVIILRPEDRYIREKSIPLIRRELKDPSITSQSVNNTGELLGKHELPVKIHKKDDRTSFFVLNEGKRIPVFSDTDGFRLESGKTLSREKMTEWLESEPAAFSPAAVLRPIVQDALFPVAATVLGPNELAYHLLLHDVYQRHNVPRPALAARFGLTLIEPKTGKWIDKYQLTPDDLQSDPAAIVKKLTRRQTPENDETATEKIKQEIASYFVQLKTYAQTVDASIVKSLDKNLFRVLQEIDNAENLVVRREADKNQTMRNQVEAVLHALCPNHQLQERHYNIVYFLMKYGFEFASRLKEVCRDLDAGEHVFVRID